MKWKSWHWLRDTVGAFSDLLFPPSCACCGCELDEPTRLCSSETEIFDDCRWEPAFQTHSSPAPPPHLAVIQTENISELADKVIRENEFDVFICRNCWALMFPFYATQCLACGARIDLPSRQVPSSPIPMNSCGCCRRSRFRFKRCFALGNYEGELRQAVLKIKKGINDALVYELAKCAAAQVKNWNADGIIPVPMHWHKRLTRKVFVAEMFAEQLSHRLNVPVLRVLKSSRATQKQGLLSTTDRVKNVRHSMKLRRSDELEGKHVLLVDDVMTSGATANEAALTCLRGGAAEVRVVVIARGVGRSLNR